MNVNFMAKVIFGQMEITRQKFGKSIPSRINEGFILSNVGKSGREGL